MGLDTVLPLFSSYAVSAHSAYGTDEDQEVRLLPSLIPQHSYPGTLLCPQQYLEQSSPSLRVGEGRLGNVFFLVSKTMLCPFAVGELLHPSVFLHTFQVLELAGSKIKLTFTYQAACSDAFNSFPQVEGQSSLIFLSLILLFSCLTSPVRRSLKKASGILQ